MPARTPLRLRPRLTAPGLVLALLSLAVSPSARADHAPDHPLPCNAPASCSDVCGVGVALRWNSCFGDGGTSNRAFACDTNTGSERLVGSFVLRDPLTGVGGVTCDITIQSSTAAIPPWWQLSGAGTCRLASLSLSALPPAGSVACLDWTGGADFTGIGYPTTYLLPDRARLRLVAGVSGPDFRALAGGVEYVAFSLTINHTRTVGANACTGCATPMCIALSGVEVSADSGGPYGTTNVLGPAFGTGSDLATWQGGIVTAYQPGQEFHEPCRFQVGFVPIEFSCSDAVTANRNRTWGAIKSLYR